MPKNEKPLSDYTEKSQSDLEESKQTREHKTFPFKEAINSITNNLGKIISESDQESEREQKDQILTNIAHFILDKVDWSENTLEISKNAACFLCQEEDPCLRTEETPSQPTQRVIDAIQECLIVINYSYEKSRDPQHLLRTTEIFYTTESDKNTTVRRIKEDITWDSIPSEIREHFSLEYKEKISYCCYPPQ